MANSITDILKAVEGEPKPADDAMSQAMAAYEAKFGYLPYGIGMPELTVGLLQRAVESGEAIVERLPDGAVS